VVVTVCRFQGARYSARLARGALASLNRYSIPSSSYSCCWCCCCCSSLSDCADAAAGGAAGACCRRRCCFCCCCCCCWWQQGSCRGHKPSHCYSVGMMQPCVLVTYAHPPDTAIIRKRSTCNKHMMQHHLNTVTTGGFVLTSVDAACVASTCGSIILTV